MVLSVQAQVMLKVLWQTPLITASLGQRQCTTQSFEQGALPAVLQR